jgi:hypothetical protein
LPPRQTKLDLHCTSPEHNSNPPQLSRSFLQLATPRSFNDWALKPAGGKRHPNL